MKPMNDEKMKCLKCHYVLEPLRRTFSSIVSVSRFRVSSVRLSFEDVVVVLQHIFGF
jgi:hypothetical protein